MTRTTEHTVALAATALALGLALPGAASAAGTANVDSSGNLRYLGDPSGNVVLVNATRTVDGKHAVTFTEAGIAEGSDPKNLCRVDGNSVSCTVEGTALIEVFGLEGPDELTLGGAVDGIQVHGDGAADKLVGAEGGESLYGGPGRDELQGGGGADTLVGGPSADVVEGGDGNDTSSYDEGGDDVIELGGGRDAFFVNNQDGTDDTLDGGPGADILLFGTRGNPPDKSARVDLVKGVASWDEFEPYPKARDVVAGIEDVVESQVLSGNDVLIGNSGSNLLAGGRGDDTIVGGGGTDTLIGDKVFSSPDVVFPGAPGNDKIDAFDGFEDRVECDEGADSLVADQFDGGLAAACEDIDERRANPFGIAPSPPAPLPAPPASPAPVPPAPPAGGDQIVRDVRAPSCSGPTTRPQRRREFLKRGYSFNLRCDEHARVEVTASVAVKRAAGRRLELRRAGDLVLDARELDVTSGRSKVTVKVPRVVRGVLGKRFTVRLRIEATDRAGNRATQLTNFKVG